MQLRLAVFYLLSRQSCDASLSLMTQTGGNISVICKKYVTFPANERDSSPSLQGVLSFLSYLYHPDGQREIPNASGVQSVEKQNACSMTYLP